MSWEDRIISIFLVLLGATVIAILSALAAHAWQLVLSASAA